MTNEPQGRPPVPLDDLYALVPAAQEEDLLEEVRLADAERLARDLAPTYVDAEPEDEDLPDPGAVGDADEAWRVSPAQAVALLGHELGARPVEEPPGPDRLA